MRMAVTGATGVVGKKLVTLLAAAGVDLLLVGRRPERILRLFPGQRVCGYDELEERAVGFDVLVHLAVVNNDANVDEALFHDVNVQHVLYTVERAKRAGIPRFVHVSSVHVFDSSQQSAYVRSKREAERLLANVEGISVVTVYLPAVHGDEWSGRLAFLNKLPQPLARAAFEALASLRPTVHVSRFATFLLERGAEDGEKGEIILSDGQDENLVYHIMKRAIDLLFALSVVLLFWWGLALIWAAIRLQSPGPGIFAQKRIGKDGVQFTCYKFRTMKQGTIQAATHEVLFDTVTGVGRFLRRAKLDELPQIWNILRNEVTLVGPRPCLPVQTELIEARRRYDVIRLKPGITGLAQVNDIDMREPEKLARWDARYAALQSLLLDLRIIAGTAIGKGRGDKVAEKCLGQNVR